MDIHRAPVVDNNFINRVSQNDLPTNSLNLTLKDSNLNKKQYINLLETTFISRHIDFIARILKEKNLSFYTISSAGHEANAAIALATSLDDMAYLHYRSLSFMLMRSKMNGEKNYIKDHLLALCAKKDCPISSGRHKVFGSVTLNTPPQTSTIASHLPKSVGAAFGLQLVKELKLKSKINNNSVILTSFGDASLYHSTALGAINTASRYSFGNIPLPIVFICEDNGIGISVKTPNNWIKSTVANNPYLTYLYCDGRSLLDVYNQAQTAIHIARRKQRPVFLHMQTVRLLGHAGSDIEFHYKTINEIEKTESDDPLLHFVKTAIDENILTKEEVLKIYEDARQVVNKQAEMIIDLPVLSSKEEIMASIVPPKLKIKTPKLVSDKIRHKYFNPNDISHKQNMATNINNALADILLQYDNTVLFGEDVGKKGGVYRVTKDLQKRFGVKRVFDYLLDEQSILGAAIGFSQVGLLPIPEIQFLAYTLNAVDQIRGEAATASFFSNGNYPNPCVIRIAGFAYQKGFGGHFHNDNAIAFLREIPGIIIAVPANGYDAALMLKECVRLAYVEQRVVIFIEPIALYMTKDLHTKGDNLWSFIYPPKDETIELGKTKSYGEDSDTVIITYGNGVYLSLQAQKILQDKYNKNIKVIDLRFLKPIDYDNLITKCSNANNIIIVDECRKQGSLSEEIITEFYERGVKAKLKRVTASDSFITLGTSWQYLLPSADDIVKAVLPESGAVVIAS